MSPPTQTPTVEQRLKAMFSQLVSTAAGKASLMRALNEAGVITPASTVPAPASMAEAQAPDFTSLIAEMKQSDAGRLELNAGLNQNGLAVMNLVSAEFFPTVTDPARTANARRGIILDCETTGTDTARDEITQLAMIEFFYDEQGILSLGRDFDQLNEPSLPITEEVTRLTGITAEKVRGHRILDADVASFIEGAEMVMAHFASFDRKIVERCLPDAGFDLLPWFCSVDDVDWGGRGKGTKKLEALLPSEGYVYPAHRANADILAVAFILGHTDTNGRSAFAELLENGSKSYLHIVADDAPFKSKTKGIDCKVFFKERGYRWTKDGSEAHGYSSWHKMVPLDQPELLQEEASFLLSQVYTARSKIPSFVMDARNRFSDIAAIPEVPFLLRDPLNRNPTVRDAPLVDESAFDAEPESGFRLSRPGSPAPM